MDVLLEEFKVILENEIEKEACLVNGRIAKTKYGYYQLSNEDKVKVVYVGGQFSLSQLFKRKERRSSIFKPWID